ncbi:MAG: YIP1 family protein [Vicinamibacteraceae bacterium]
MLTSPKATFESVVSFPRWFDIFAITVALSIAVSTAFFWSEVGQSAFIDQMKAGNPAVTDQQAQMAMTVTKYATPIAGPIFAILFVLALAGILLGVFAITGGAASYKQVLAVVVHAGVVSTVAQVVLMIANYVRGSMVSITSLQGLGQLFAEHGFMAGFLGAIDLWWFWYLLVLAIGLGVLYRRRTAPIFVSFTALYLVIALVVGVYKAATAGGS